MQPFNVFCQHCIVFVVVDEQRSSAEKEEDKRMEWKELFNAQSVTPPPRCTWPLFLAPACPTSATRTRNNLNNNKIKQEHENKGGSISVSHWPLAMSPLVSFVAILNLKKSYFTTTVHTVSIYIWRDRITPYILSIHMNRHNTLIIHDVVKYSDRLGVLLRRRDGGGRHLAVHYRFVCQLVERARNTFQQIFNWPRLHPSERPGWIWNREVRCVVNF